MVRKFHNVYFKLYFVLCILNIKLIQFAESRKGGLLWKVQQLILFNFLALLPNFYFWSGDWATGCTDAYFSDMPEISLFPKIFSLKVTKSAAVSYIIKHLITFSCACQITPWKICTCLIMEPSWYRSIHYRSIQVLIYSVITRHLFFTSNSISLHQSRILTTAWMFSPKVT